jgi:coenzyme PQQ precursor peptide PqqA
MVQGTAVDKGRRHRQTSQGCGLIVRQVMRRSSMAWTPPKLREICMGMEINGYFAGKL